jgi:hypothetical protein
MKAEKLRNPDAVRKTGMLLLLYCTVFVCLPSAQLNLLSPAITVNLALSDCPYFWLRCVAHCWGQSKFSGAFGA